MLTGSFASSYYGAPRGTRASDLDRAYLEHWIERLGLVAQWDAAQNSAALKA